MTKSEAQEEILSVARVLTAGQDATDAYETARDRNWIDSRGAPTPLGREVVDAMMDQTGTRTVFRPFV